MKILKHILAAAVLLAAACDHDPDPIVFAPTDLSIVGHSKVVVDDATADEDFTLVWNVRFASASEVDYTVEAALDKDSEFVVLGTTSVCRFTCKNSAIFDKLGVDVSGDYSFVFRVTAASAAGETKQASLTVAFAYDHIATLGVTGSFQGWAPDKAPQLWGDASKGIYWGYVSLYGGDNDPILFKFTSKPNWDGPNYGKSDTEGVLTDDGSAGNLELSAGLYRFDVDLAAMIYKATPITKVALIGAGVGSWDTDQVELVRDAADGLYKAAGVAAVGGEFKIRFNGAWNDAIGDLGGDAEDLTIGGGNLKIEAGTYDFALDLAHTPYKLTVTAHE